jgi:hypothetical protein
MVQKVSLNFASMFENFNNCKGDGVTDDTAVINAAISTGNRCGPGSCNGSTLTPAVVCLKFYAKYI